MSENERLTVKRHNIELAAANTQVGMIRDLCVAGKTQREAFNALRPLVDSQTPPMVFNENIGGSRTPKPIADQYQMLQDHIGRIYRAMGRSRTNRFDSPLIDAPVVQTPIGPVTVLDNETDTEIDSTDNEIESEDDSQSDDSEELPVASGKKRRMSAKERFLSEVRRIRELCIRRSTDDPVDSISLRPLKAANRLIDAGVPVDALLASIALHWKDSVRSDFNIPSFDFAAYSAEVMSTRSHPRVDSKGMFTRSNGAVEKLHNMFGYGLILAECRQHIMLVGPAGTGKSHMLRQLADYMQLPYGETAMSPGATRGDLMGRHTIGGLDRAIALSALLRTEKDPETLESLRTALQAVSNGDGGGFISSVFNDMFGGGGLMNFDEIDSADAGTLIVINGALEADSYYNSATGTEVVKSANFIAGATANTWGLGSNREYTGRSKLDFATLDRFRMGRMWIPLDPALEEWMLFRDNPVGA
jgi:AAA domain (dynein-related subfamily)